MQSQTYKNFQKLSPLYKDQNATLNDVTLEYQETSDPICFSFVFCRLYPLMLNISSRFFYLTESDKDSFCMEELNKAMRDYDDYFHSGTSIQTLFSRYLRNRLRTETEQLSYDKRCANNAAESYDVAFDAMTYRDPFLDQIEMMESLKSYKLSSNELKYCELIIQNSDKIKGVDIADILGVTSAAVNHIKKSLVRKLNFAI